MANVTNPQLVYKEGIDSTSKGQISERILIPYYSLYSDKIVIHPKPFNLSAKRKYNQKSKINLQKKKFAGNISKTQKSIIKKKLTAWLSSILVKNNQNIDRFIRYAHYPVFITLTLSANQIHNDKEIKRVMLDAIIKKLKSKYNVNQYFWRAESQKTGRIHFHLIVDKYVSYYDLKRDWNKIQNRLGYIDKFAKVHNHKNPNSVDVKSAADVNNFINYILKYCAKDEKNRKIEGRIYGMSDNLREINIYQSVLCGNLSSNLNRYIKHNYLKVYKAEYFTILYFTDNFYQTTFYESLKLDSEKYYLQLYHSIYNSKSKSKKIINYEKRNIVEKYKQLELTELTNQIKIINNYNHINMATQKRYGSVN